MHSHQADRKRSLSLAVKVGIEAMKPPGAATGRSMAGFAALRNEAYGTAGRGELR